MDIPAPQRTRDQDGCTDYSFVNQLVTNGAVIACFRYGSRLLCITQQQAAMGERS